MTEPAQGLRIAVAEDDPDHRQMLLRALEQLGHEVLGVAETGRQLAELCETNDPDLVITDIQMPDIDGLQAAKEITAIRPVPIIVVTSHHDQDLIDRAMQDHVLAFLVKPVTSANLAPSIALAQQRFHEFETLRSDNANLSQALQDRKTIERAKGLLMKQAGLDEPTAFKRLQQLARDKRMKLAEVSRMVITAADALRPE